jgi:transglutaminase-like putative cysteine protease
MINRLYFLVGILSFYFPAFAGDGQYAVSKIPADLIKNARMVVRLEEEKHELVSAGKIQSKYHYVYTILDEEGAKWADLMEDYDKFHDVKSIEGVLYDASGNKIKSLKSKDIQDMSGNQGMSLADDVRYKVYSFYYKSYPFTVEYTIEKINYETMFFPNWMPVGDEYISVEKSQFQFKAPADYVLRYRESSKAPVAMITPDGNAKLYSWTLEQFPAQVKEYASPAWIDIVPNVILGPSRFSIEDYAGDMTDWNALGKFVLALNKDRDQLPPSVKQKIAELTKNITGKQEKIKVLYNFLQSTTRYISIQLGIGGWRPFEAADVAQRAYGDCKALSNYMVAILKEAGIPAYYALIKAGEIKDDILVDFPSSQFNHAIVCVPDGKDTTWLECTSQTQAPGYMGSFTGNRHALLITENGGKLVSTPVYKLKDNEQARKITATLDDEGHLDMHVQANYKALLQDELQSMINVLSKDKIKEHLHEDIDLPTYEISEFSYKETKSTIPEIGEILDMKVENYATVTGKRLFLVPNIMNRFSRRLTADDNRKFDIVLKMEYAEVDSTEIIIPNGYVPESIPQDISISSPFGNYQCHISLQGNKVTYHRRLERFSGIFPAAKYNDLVSFYDRIYKADRNKLVLVKN